MIVEDNILKVSDENNYLRRIEDRLVVGKSYGLGYVYYKNGVKLDIPYELTILDFEEVSPEIIMQENQNLYCTMVARLVRERYSLDDELAIQRQRDEKKEAFRDYYNYCEECKLRAKRELGIDYGTEEKETDDSQQ